MSVNMFCESQKVSSKEFLNNWDYIFKRYWVVVNAPPGKKCMKCRLVDGAYEDVKTGGCIKPDKILSVFESEDAALSFIEG